MGHPSSTERPTSLLLLRQQGQMVYANASMRSLLTMVPRQMRQMSNFSALFWRQVSCFNSIISYFLALISNQSLSYRFYLFSCANCNHGVEFLRRLHMSIEDVVHLMMFNLSLHHSKSYYDLSNVIHPYIKDNWHALQLPPKVCVQEIVLEHWQFFTLTIRSIPVEEYDEQRYKR